METFVKVLHEARENFMDISKVEFNEDLVVIDEDLTDSEKESVIQYHIHIVLTRKLQIR